MFHLLSKLLVIFIYPLTWILTLLIFAVFVKKDKYKKNAIIASVAILWLFSNNFLLNQFARLWDITKKPDMSKTYSCAIILGGFASEGPKGQGHFNGSSDRFIQAVKLINNHKVSSLLISGGNGMLKKSDFIEADYVHDELKDFNVPDSLILIENKSRNTLENAQFSGVLLKEKNLPPPYLLVTSSFHMRRALTTFKKADLEVVAYPCDYKAGLNSVEFDDFIPKADALMAWNGYIKEVIGCVAYYFKS
jgi:uncharacterized SAM-binding protein YcdF (DUF218 family)